jgi:hypothetical protein
MFSLSRNEKSTQQYKKTFPLIRTLTVGIGISPIRPLHKKRFADFTAGGELHPALKIFCVYIIFRHF